MTKTLTSSKTNRSNLLNNPFAIQEVQKQLRIRTYSFEGKQYVTVKEITEFYNIDIRTFRRYLAANEHELKDNGYRILSKDELDRFINLYVGDISVTNISSKSPKLALFSFRSFLNFGMLLTNNDIAKALRSLLLDIALDSINQKSGGNTKFINQRDENYLISLYLGEKYNEKFKDALKNYVDLGNFKYAIFGSRIYQIIFKEHVDEYRKLLKLQKEEKIKDTLYSEVLTTISSFQAGLADRISSFAKAEKRSLSVKEVNDILDKLSKDPLVEPQLELARTKMASFDNAFRDAEHESLSDYIGAVNEEDYQRFLGEKSMELQDRIKKQQDIFKRLKDK